MGNVKVPNITRTPVENGSNWGSGGQLPAGITDLSAAALSTTVVTLSGTAAATDIRWLQVKLTSAAIWQDWAQPNIAAGAFTYDVTGLSVGSAYDFRLFNQTGGAESNTTSATTTGAQGTTAGALTTGTVTSSSIQVLLVEDPTNYTTMQLQENIAGGGWVDVAGVTSVGAFPVSRTGLADSTSFQYRLDVDRSLGTQIYSATITKSTPATGSGLYVTADFESGTLGAVALGSDGFSDTTTGVYSNDYARTGSQSVKTSITAGTTGFGEWGGLFGNNIDLVEGDEYWYRTCVYFPAGFNFTSGSSEGVKFMRSQIKSPAGAHLGYWNYFLDTAGVTFSTSVVNGINTAFYDAYPWTAETSNRTGIQQVGAAIETGQWVVFEHYLKLHSVPGQAAMRMWRDGVLIFENTALANLPYSDSKLVKSSVFTYWNNNAPATQSCYIDDVVITSTTPANTDAAGNKFIGLT